VALVRLDNSRETIATRKRLLIRENNPTEEEVFVLLGKPQTLPDHKAFFCPYQVRGAGDEKAKVAYGTGGFQALQLALSILSVDLEVLTKELGGKLRSECDEKGWLGFPVFEALP
jgi:hypothetical protein